MDNSADAGRPPAVALTGIAKRFPGVIANHDIDLRVDAGTVHALVGENGAGKSTLMKVLYGMHQPDAGTIDVNGQRVRLRSPTDAIALGIGMVHQHFMLADNLTVIENVVLGSEPGRFGRLDYGAARERIESLGAAYGLHLDPDEQVETLGVGERQRVEILKVLYRGARILVLDEPTAVLVPQETIELFGNLRRLKSEGVTIVFISHKLDEVLEIADTITVMRGGATVATVAPNEVNRRSLGELMVGSELPSPEARESTVTDRVLLSVSGLTAADDAERPLVTDVDFEIRSGEVVGIAGVEGNGQFELVEALLGLRPAEGCIRLGDVDLHGHSTRDRREAGLAYIPFDRHREGLLLDAPLWENVMLGQQSSRRFRSGPWIRPGAARRVAAEVVGDFDVRTPGVDVPAFALSGGNQQKLIVGRELTADPKVLIAAHPTRGVDVGAQAAIWERLRQARATGLGVLLISADLDELIGLSDTLLVMFRGAITATLDPATVTPDELGLHMTGATGSPKAAA